MNMKHGYVYLMASDRRGKTYLGVTSNLLQRAYQHRNGLIEGYSKDNHCHVLVWFEHFADLQDARACEYRMKKWKREWKWNVIGNLKPEWRGLFDGLLR